MHEYPCFESNAEILWGSSNIETINVVGGYLSISQLHGFSLRLDLNINTPALFFQLVCLQTVTAKLSLIRKRARLWRLTHTASRLDATASRQSYLSNRKVSWCAIPQRDQSGREKGSVVVSAGSSRECVLGL